MASDDGSILLGIPGAWVSKELDPDSSLPAPLTPPSRKKPAYIRTPLKESPTLLPSCDPLPSTPILVTLGPHESDLRVKRTTVVIPVDPDTAAEVIPQGLPSSFDGVSNTSSTLLPSPIDAPPSPLPEQHIEKLTANTTPVRTGFPPKYDPDFDFSAPQGDLAYKAFSSQDSLNYSVIDGFPSSASINLIPTIPSLMPDLDLQNFPISDGQSLEPHSIYFSTVEDDLSMSRRSDDGPEPGHETSTSCRSASELCIPTAEEAHHQIFWQENPSPRRPTARIEVQSDAFRLDRRGRARRESFTYACKALPYDAGLRPHAYVDNREYTIHGKNHLEALAEDLYAMEEFMEEDHVAGESKRPTIFRKLVDRKRISKLVTLDPIKFRKTPKRYSAHSCATDQQSPTASSSVENFVDQNPVTTNK